MSKHGNFGISKTATKSVWSYIAKLKTWHAPVDPTNVSHINMEERTCKNPKCCLTFKVTPDSKNIYHSRLCEKDHEGEFKV
jgi:hypothetical protein